MRTEAHGTLTSVDLAKRSPNFTMLLGGYSGKKAALGLVTVKTRIKARHLMLPQVAECRVV